MANYRNSLASPFFLQCPSVVCIFHWNCSQKVWQQQLFNGPLFATTRLSQYQKIHPLIPILIINHPLSTSSIYYISISCSFYMLHSLFAQPLSKFSLVYLLVWNPPIHTPYISSPNHCLLFTTHAHTIATCFAVVPRLCHLFLVALSTL